MNIGKTLFAQVMSFVPWTSFARIVERYNGDAGVRTFSCAEQFRAMAFAQITWRESLRDIEVSLAANPTKLHAMGFRHAVKRSTLADANELRDWHIWADLAAILIARARKLYLDEPLASELASTVYALDSSTIDLCLSMFAWAPFRQAKAAIKLHTLLDLRGAIPAFIHVSDGKYAVKTQIWCAIATYVLIAILKKELKLDASLYTCLQILSVSIFEKTPIFQALSQKDSSAEADNAPNQLNLFDF